MNGTYIAELRPSHGVETSFLDINAELCPSPGGANLWLVLGRYYTGHPELYFDLYLAGITSSDCYAAFVYNSAVFANPVPDSCIIPEQTVVNRITGPDWCGLARFSVGWGGTAHIVAGP